MSDWQPISITPPSDVELMIWHRDEGRIRTAWFHGRWFDRAGKPIEGSIAEWKRPVSA